jgi:hypothetical protein
MAPFDAPHVTHDMMLRFMGANFSAIVDGSAKISSSLGNVAKPVFVETDTQSTSIVMPAKTPQQDKAMWEGMCPLTMILILALTFYLTHLLSSLLQCGFRNSSPHSHLHRDCDFHLVSNSTKQSAITYSSRSRGGGDYTID